MLCASIGGERTQKALAEDTVKRPGIFPFGLWGVRGIGLLLKLRSFCFLLPCITKGRLWYKQRVSKIPVRETLLLPTLEVRL